MPTTKPDELIETTQIVFKPVLAEDAGGRGKRLVVRGEFARCGVPTANGRIYPRQLWEREIARLREAMRARKVTGELNHPRDGVADMFNTSHLLTGLTITPEGIVLGEAEVLENLPGGKVVAEIYRSGGKVGVSSRGFGSTRPDAQGRDVVQDDYELKTFDFVADPADQYAYPDAVTESQNQPRTGAHMSSPTRILEGVADVRSAIIERIVLDPASLPPAAYESLRKHFQAEGTATQAGEVAKLTEERDAAVAKAKALGYQLFIERTAASMGDEGDALIEAVGDVSQYESAAALKEAVEAATAKLQAERSEVTRTEAHAAALAEERAGYAQRIEHLEGTVRDLLALVEGLSDGTAASHDFTSAPARRPRASAQSPRQRDAIDEIVESARRRPASSETARERVRSTLGRGARTSGATSSMVEERSTGRGGSGDQNYMGLGASLGELRSLSGIG